MQKPLNEMTPAEYQAFMKGFKEKKEQKQPRKERPKSEAEIYFNRPYQTILAEKKRNPAFYAAMSADLDAQHRGKPAQNDRNARYKRFKDVFSLDIRISTLKDVRKKAERLGMLLESPEELNSFYDDLKKEKATV